MNADLMVENVIWTKNGIVMSANVTVKSIIYAKKKYYAWNPSKCTCDIDGYLKGIVNDLAIVCD